MSWSWSSCPPTIGATKKRNRSLPLELDYAFVSRAGQTPRSTRVDAQSIRICAEQLSKYPQNPQGEWSHGPMPGIRQVIAGPWLYWDVTPWRDVMLTFNDALRTLAAVAHQPLS